MFSNIFVTLLVYVSKCVVCDSKHVKKKCCYSLPRLMLKPSILLGISKYKPKPGN